MAIKKSELYASLWDSCNVLRGGMDASQYKDYVLFLLFLKYVSDKYAGQKYAPISIPKGASFRDLVALKGNPNIGDLINKQIVAPIEAENNLSDFPDFNSTSKLGSGKTMVDTLTSLIAVFENPALDFSSNRAGGDDILGDAYEFLMKNFAVQSGKSKGQFYTPAEVSRILARAVGIHRVKTTPNTTAYDPTPGSGSLLLKVADAASTKIALFGQEKDVATVNLARMNMALHDNAEAEIEAGNTLSDPKFKEGDRLQTFDFVVANPPFSDKYWTTGLDPIHDLYDRFVPYGVPPRKNGDYAFLLHIIASMKTTAKGACILPHGVLFRGNAEADIRKNLIKRGYIKAIIGLPGNLFYGTGIPACIIVLDKENASKRESIFMIDASKGFKKDGPKNRLRERDIHKIIDTLEREDESDPKYARRVPLAEIASARNDYNLNITRYIDSSEPEDIQSLEAHLQGGIPAEDVEALGKYWALMPSLREILFKPLRKGFVKLGVKEDVIRKTILGHPEFRAFVARAQKCVEEWEKKTVSKLSEFKKGQSPKKLIVEISEDLLSSFKTTQLVDPYSTYQLLLDYWDQTMQDDCYAVADDGWIAAPHRVVEKDEKKGKVKDKGWACDLLPKELVVLEYFSSESKKLENLLAELEKASSEKVELEELHGAESEDGYLGSLGKLGKTVVSKRLKEVVKEEDSEEEAQVLRAWLAAYEKEQSLAKDMRDLGKSLDKLAYEKYSSLSPSEVRKMVIGSKWMPSVTKLLEEEVERVSQGLTSRVLELAERYDVTLPATLNSLLGVSEKVNQHLKKMGAAWN
jgi:type I restriction enzyme M protein